MKLPSTVAVGPHAYTVVTDDRAVSIMTARNPIQVGRCNCHDLTLTVDPSIPDSQQLDTLLHELLHALFFMTDIDATLNTHDDGLDERVISRLTPALMDLLVRNPDLRRLFARFQ